GRRWIIGLYSMIVRRPSRLISVGGLLLARYLKPHRSNPDLSAGRLERLAIMGLGLGLTGALSGIVSGLAAPVLGSLGAFAKPLATLATALGVEMGANAFGAGDMARELGDGGQLLFIGQAAAAAGLPVGISSTFPSLGNFGAAPAVAAPASG